MSDEPENAAPAASTPAKAEQSIADKAIARAKAATPVVTPSAAATPATPAPAAVETVLTLEDVRKLIAEGHGDEAIEKLGGDASAYKGGAARMRTAKRMLREAEDARAKALETETQVNQRIEAGTQRFGLAMATEGAIAKQDWIGVSKSITAMLQRFHPELTFGKLTALIAQSTVPTTPSEHRLLQEVQSLKARLDAPKAPETPKPVAPEAKPDVGAQIKAKLKGHGVEGVPDYDVLVRAEMRRHYDPALKGASISLKQAADNVLGRHKPSAKPEEPRPTRPRVRDSNGQFQTPPAKEPEAGIDTILQKAKMRAMQKAAGAGR